MNKIIKYILRIVIIIAVVLLLLLTAEVLVYRHDSAKNTTRSGALKEQGDAAVQGLNLRREFKEIRFRAGDINLWLVTKKITAEEALLIPGNVRGNVTATLNDADYCKFAFKLSESSLDDANSTAAKPKTGVMENTVLNLRVDRDYKFVPATESDEPEYAKFSERSFRKGDKLLVDIELEGPVPRTANFLFVYRRAPKSVLHGTFLQRLGEYAITVVP